MSAPPQTQVLPLLRRGDWWVLEIRGGRDLPGYIPKDVGRGMSENRFRREVLGDWSAASGKVVYPEYGDIHEAKEPLEFDPTLPLVLGWDLPGSTGGTPACVITQVNHAGQWLIFRELAPPPDQTIGLYEFGEWVARVLDEEFAEPADVPYEQLRLLHYADPAGQAKPVATVGTTNARLELRSAYDILLRGDRVVTGYNHRDEPLYHERPGFGWVMKQGEVSLRKRMESVRARLKTILRGGAPALVVDPRAVLIREGFRGAYCYAQRTDGQYELDPQKNRWADPMNALEYAASRLFTVRPSEEPWQPPQAGMARGVGRRGRGERG